FWPDFLAAAARRPPRRMAPHIDAMRIAPLRMPWHPGDFEQQVTTISRLTGHYEGSPWHESTAPNGARQPASVAQFQVSNTPR
ncbi:MAG TPA: hypothetical protein VF306_04265, partial [Pirellulales bacterium]